MNHSSRRGAESIGQRKAELERQLRQAAEIRNAQRSQPSTRLKVKWAAIGAATISVVGTIAFVLISHAR